VLANYQRTMVIIAAVGMCGLGGLACQKKKEASRRPDEEQTQKAEQKAQIPQPPKDALAIVGDEVITINDLEVRIRNQQPGVSELYSRSLEKKKYLLEQLVRTELLARDVVNHDKRESHPIGCGLGVG